VVDLQIPVRKTTQAPKCTRIASEMFKVSNTILACYVSPKKETKQDKADEKEKKTPLKTGPGDLWMLLRCRASHFFCLTKKGENVYPLVAEC